MIVVTAAEMRALDRWTIEHGTPGHVLMERAGAGATQVLRERLLHPKEMAAFRKARKPSLYLAKSFAVKEAFVKALGTGFVGVAHEDIASTRSLPRRTSTSRSWMWRRSSRRWTVMPSAPARSAMSAASTGSG